MSAQERRQKEAVGWAAGFVLVKKVPGTLHFLAKSPGHSFDFMNMNMTHVVHQWYFGNKPSPRRRTVTPPSTPFRYLLKTSRFLYFENTCEALSPFTGAHHQAAAKVCTKVMCNCMSGGAGSVEAAPQGSPEAMYAYFRRLTRSLHAFL